MITKESVFLLTNTIGEIYSVSKLNKGFQNTIYKIRSEKGDFCLRVSERNTKKHVQYEIDILNCLKNLPVIQLQKVQGEYIFMVEGKTAILYVYIDGTVNLYNTDNELNSVGKFLGIFHTKCASITYEKGRSELYNLPDKTIEEYLIYIHKIGIPYREFLPEIVDELRDNILSTSHPSGPIHVDLGPKNVLWKDGELAAVLDFDNAYRGPYILDIGKSLMFFASSTGIFDTSKAKAFFEGYLSERALNDTERGEIYKAIKFAFLSHIFVDYYMYAKKITTKTYFDYIIHDLFLSYKSFLMEGENNPDFLYVS